MPLSSFKKCASNLQGQILAGLILGILAGFVLGERAALLDVVGRIFIRLLMVVILPLVIASIFVAVAGFSDLAKLGRLAGLSVGYILLMTALAAAWGVASALVIKPGRSFDPSAQAKILSEYQSQAQARLKAVETKPTVGSLVLNLVPGNPFQAAAEGNLLQMILFTAFFAWGASKIAPDKRQGLFLFFDGVNAAAGKMIQWVLRIAPVGVFALMAVAVGKFGLGLLVNLGTYVAVVVVGTVLFFLLVHFVVVHFIARRGFLDFRKSIRAAQIMAAATTSSMVTLPVSVDCAENNLHVPARLTRFVLPLAATIGHDGAGIYQGYPLSSWPSCTASGFHFMRS
jgi:Na+/H+-dicarboxylate symporter